VKSRRRVWRLFARRAARHGAVGAHGMYSIFIEFMESFLARFLVFGVVALLIRSSMACEVLDSALYSFLDRRVFCPSLRDSFNSSNVCWQSGGGEAQHRVVDRHFSLTWPGMASLTYCI
jgi:hypothetical protein